MSRRAARKNGGGPGHGVIDLDQIAPRRPEIYNCQGLLAGAESSTTCSTSVPPPPRRRPEGKKASQDSGVSGESRIRSRRHIETDERDEAIQQFREQCASALLEQRAQLARVARLCARLSRHAGEMRGERGSDVTVNSGRAETQKQKTEKTRDRQKPSRIPIIAREPIRIQRCEEKTSLFDKSVRNESKISLCQQNMPSDIDFQNNERRMSADVVSRSSNGEQRFYPPDASAACRQVAARLEELVRGWIQRATPSPDDGGKVLVERGVSARPLISSSTRTRVVNSRHSSETHCGLGDCAHCQYHLEDPVKLYQQSKLIQRPVTRRARSADNARHVDCGTKEVINRHQSPLSSHNRIPNEFDRKHPNEPEQSPERGSRKPREVSLCALCRMYWRAIRRRLVDVLADE